MNSPHEKVPLLKSVRLYVVLFLSWTYWALTRDVSSGHKYEIAGAAPGQAQDCLLSRLLLRVVDRDLSRCV